VASTCVLTCPPCPWTPASIPKIFGAIAKIRRYTSGLSGETFARDDKTVDAVVRNLEVIGEAVTLRYTFTCPAMAARREAGRRRRA
jgi:hypothetical protein